ncbi:MAG TPA: hypothetical protein VI759_09970 [Dehalococcoidia bacterium]|nr:hypothetical protein [Dehalococcoidia bacterium]
MSEAESRAQLARLLGDETLRDANAARLAAASEAGFERFVDGLLDEAAASDDVSDRDSAIAFVESRLRAFEAVLPDDLRSRLLEALRTRIDAW